MHYKENLIASCHLSLFAFNYIHICIQMVYFRCERKEFI